MELTRLSLGEAAHRLRTGEISPIALAEAYLARIDRFDGTLRAYITVTRELALRQARTAADVIRQGGYLGPLHGMPLAIKDVIETQAVRTTAGSKMLADYVPEQDSAVAARLNTAGAILLGKANLHEWALGVINANPFYGACLNPWNTAHIPGGSSGGSAAALAAELCAGALGSDTGGSIRVPAALCGVVGLKPTSGRVSLRGVLPVSWNLDHVGPMARRVYDVAVLLQAIVGYDAADPYSVNVPVDNYLAEIGGGVHGWRVAVADQGYFANADPSVRAAVLAAARKFEQLGAQLHGADLPIMLAGDMISTDAAAYHRARLQQQPQDFGDDVRARLQLAAATSAPDYALARRAQAILRRQLETFFSDYDLLLTPTTPTTAPGRAQLTSAEGTRLNLIRFTVPFNLAGFPALSLPCGFDQAGLPIGLQLVTRPWTEAALLRAGQAYEQSTDWHLARPSL